MPIFARCGGDEPSPVGTAGGDAGTSDGSTTDDGSTLPDGEPGDGSTPPPDGSTPPPDGSTPPPDGEVVAFVHPDGYAALVEAKEGATPSNVSAALDALGAGEDKAIAVSLDGTYFALLTTRFGCDGWDCLALVSRDVSSGHAVAPGGEVAHPERAMAVGPNGAWIVYADNGTAHERDLFITHRNGTSWSAGQNLTAASTHTYNMQPAPSHDGTKVVYDCSPVPYGGDGTGICEVGLDGSGWRQIQVPGQSGWSAQALALHHPAHAPDGSIVFEMNRSDLGEHIWRLPPGATEAVMVGDFGNDNSPCVLPSGWIASLYLQRPGNTSGSHELKVMSPDGTTSFMALMNTDILDVQISCGQ